MEATLLTALTATEVFSPEDLALLQEAEAARGDVRNWPLSTFQEVFSRNSAQAVLARNLVRESKAAPLDELRTSAVLPLLPPYLDDLDSYDPADPTQYWTDPDTGEHWRWDGKGRGKQGIRSLVTGETPPTAPPGGEAHRVAIVKHTTVDGIRVPDEQEAHDANHEESDWFHQGYNVWIGRGGKAYGNVSRETRNRFLQAQARLRDTGNNNALVRRAPRVA